MKLLSEAGNVILKVSRCAKYLSVVDKDQP